MKHMNKKAIEQPQVIIYVLFVVVLTIAGIYVAFTRLGGVDITFEFQDYTSRLNKVALQLMFTPECYAIENSYYDISASPKQHFQVSSGIINWTKFNDTHIISTGCLIEQVWVSLEDKDENIKDIIWSCPAGQYSCSEPPETDRTNSAKWRQLKRSFFVLIQNGTKTDKGVLTIQLKD